MEMLYLVTALIGGSILGIQTVLLLFGIGGDEGDGHVDLGGDGGAEHPVGDHDAASDSFLKFLSFKAVISFLTFFGLTGLACGKGGFDAQYTLISAIGAGVVALFAVGYIMQLLSGLHSEGNLDLKNAVGSMGSVYLRIPSDASAPGKVTITVQGRKAEIKAITRGPEIPTGAKVKVVGLASADTLEVQPVEATVS